MLSGQRGGGGGGEGCRATKSGFIGFRVHGVVYPTTQNLALRWVSMVSTYLEVHSYTGSYT